MRCRATRWAKCRSTCFRYPSRRPMDFWTFAAYVLMVALILANGLIVRRMKITVHDEDDD